MPTINQLVRKIDAVLIQFPEHAARMAATMPARL
ncbi:hypothetical protein SAMN05192541_109274 [Bradyrhizobium arachidis]|nr:hypothetical protein SAMN05192541_109274 [Bradyrhizobium arachidis]